MNKTQIKLHIKNKINNGHDEDTIEFHTTGVFYKKNDHIFLVYDEVQDDEVIQTTIKASEEKALIMRSGAVSMKQRFQEGESSSTLYKTKYGNLRLDAYTKSLKVESDNQKGAIYIQYELDMDEGQNHLHTLSVTYKEEN
ncbi:DUF1934 domain-containing protein [Bacillus carboniphilus]|uniref:DUF1934 domain-containing protein n=1 Tax=Bacillus carboniphilus TaxID=86663 RepID=A0ABY9JTJ5_9BACI|nr:DUF1934 domain-containing protein [Bacillus carboniphilus]WLR41747.1 DUF1934 domain-containing protein [Bacillus carboniphilus]